MHISRYLPKSEKLHYYFLPRHKLSPPLRLSSEKHNSNHHKQLVHQYLLITSNKMLSVTHNSIPSQLEWMGQQSRQTLLSFHKSLVYQKVPFSNFTAYISLSYVIKLNTICYACKEGQVIFSCFKITILEVKENCLKEGKGSQSMAQSTS